MRKVCNMPGLWQILSSYQLEKVISKTTDRGEKAPREDLSELPVLSQLLLA